MRRGLRRFGALLALAAIAASLLAACGEAAPKGQQIFARVGCVACHGEKGEGFKLLEAPKLAGTQLPLDEFKKQVRTPRAQMVPFNEAQISDADLQEVYNWLKSLP